MTGLAPVLREATAALEGISPTPRLDAELLLAHALGIDRSAMLLQLRDLTAPDSYNGLLARRMADEPVAYITGVQAFWDLELCVTPDVLIPRSDSETLLEAAVDWFGEDNAPMHIADLGTGSGAVGLSILHELPFESAEVWMTDVSEDALHVARANAAGVGRNAVGARFGHGSWYEALPADLQGSLDAIVSNPPYIATGDPLVGESVLKWEPHNALFAGTDGLDDLRVVVSGAANWLVPGGLLAVEMGFTQAKVVSQLFESAGFKNVSVHKDLAGLDRFVTGSSPR